MRRVLSIVLTIALVLSVCMVPTISNAAPEDAQLKLELLEITGPTMDKAVEVSKPIKLVKGETYKLSFQITMVPPTTTEVRVRFPQSTMDLTVNGVSVPFRHRELYKYLTPKGNGEFLVVEGTAEFVADVTGTVEVAVKGNNVAGGTSVESTASATYRYTPATYAEIIQHKVRFRMNPTETEYWSIQEYLYNTEIYPTDIIDNGSEIWDIGSGVTFSKEMPAGTEIVFFDPLKNAEQPFFMAYCDYTVSGTFRNLRVKYPDGSEEDYMQDVDSSVTSSAILIRCSDRPSNPKPPSDIENSVHSIYATVDPSLARTYFNQDPAVIENGIVGMALHGESPLGNLKEILDFKAKNFPDGALGWTLNGVDIFDPEFNDPVTNRMLLYPLMPDNKPQPPTEAPYYVVKYLIGDADFYWAHEDLYGGFRADKMIVAPPVPIPNGQGKFLHWIDEEGNIVDFTKAIPVVKDTEYTAVYESNPNPSNPNPIESQPTTESTRPSDGGKDYFPPITTATSASEVTSVTTTTTSLLTSFATNGPTPGPIPTSSKSLTDLEEEEVALGGLTTTTTNPVTTIGTDNVGNVQGTGDADLPVTGLTANEVFWIGGGLIALLGSALLVFNRKRN